MVILNLGKTFPFGINQGSVVIGTRRFAGGLLLVLSTAFFCAGQALGDDDLSIGRMRVQIWPEHDDSGVLVVYDGRFTDDSRFPTTTTFFIPKGAVINDVCSLSPGGQHFCQLYEVVEGETMDKAIVSLPFSNFYLGFHTPPLDMDSEQRVIEHTIKTNHPIESMVVDIERPLRSTEFAITPAGGDRSREKGFEHFGYSLNRVSKGEETVFRIGYTKVDRMPSVDIKYSGMSGTRVWGSPYDTQRRTMMFIYALFGTGIAALAAGLGWIVFLRQRSRA